MHIKRLKPCCMVSPYKNMLVEQYNQVAVCHPTGLTALLVDIAILTEEGCINVLPYQPLSS